MKKFLLLTFLICATAGVFGQIVFTDDFNRATVSPGGTPSMTYTNTLVGTSTAAITANALRIANGTPSGLSYVTGVTSTYSAPYNTTLSANTNLVTWTFNFRYERTAGLPGGVASGSYGTAIVLAGSSSTLTTGTGYAIAYGNGGSPDPIRLVAYSAGISTSTNIISSGVADIAAATNYVSVRVTYNPTTNGWSLYLRDDGVSAWSDPSTGVTNQIGATTVNSTYTGTPLTAFGFIWSHANTVAATNASSFDNYGVSVAVSGTPTINVSTPTLSGFVSTSGVPSAVQTYTVDGSNLTTDISIVPPTGYEISPTGAFTPTNPILLTPVAGTVSTTTIQVRLNSVPLGVIAGNIMHTSTGATTQNVAVTGNVLAAEPTIQSTITIGAVTNSTVVVNFGGGNGARRILLAKLATPVSNDPVDGTTYTANANFGSGSLIGAGNYVVYDGVGNTQLVTGLTAGATYHFAIYEYNDGGIAGAENYLVPGGVGNATLLTYSVPYVWVGLNGDWQVAANWAPPRLFPATNDSLLFTSASVNDIITNVPTQTVGYIGASLLTGTTLQAAASGNTLTIGNLTGTDFFVEAGSSFNINTANALTLNLVTSATASISGNMTFSAGAHKLTAVDASAITFNSGAVFTAGTGFSSNAFGIVAVATPNSVIFTNGSIYRHISGGNPFALAQPASAVVYQTGSLFKLESNITPSVSGRTYANFELDAPASIITASGTSLLRMDNVTVTNGNITFGMTTGGFDLRGNISVATGATLNLAPASAGMLTFNGTAAQSISNSGTLTFGANQNVTMNNAAGLTLNSPVSLLGAITFTAGNINTTAANLLTMAGGSSVSGASNASYVFGPVKKIGNTAFIFPVGKSNGYVPISVSNFTGASAPTDEFTAEYIRASGNALGANAAVPAVNRISACEYWTLDAVGTPTVDLTLYWNANNPCNGTYISNVPDIEVAHFGGGVWNTSSVGFSSRTGTTAAGDVTWTNVSTFSPFTLASRTAANPLPITINYFNGTRNNGNHLLNWKVTCVSVPSATIELERSTDGRNYSSIYSIFATALRCQQPFDYTDNAPAKGVNYYRLKMTDVDGKVTYSTVVTLINAVKGIDVMNIAPNPIVTGAVNLKVSTAEKMQMELVITDMQGRVLQKQSVTMIAGFNQIPMNVKNLAAGTYQLYGNTADGRTRVLRFVIQ